MPRIILVVDDHPDTAETTAALLRTLGHEVYSALSAPSALAMANVHRPQVVFVDINLGPDNGCELAQRMRREIGLGSARFYAITGNPQENSRAEALAAGCDGYFTKPVDLATFQSVLQPTD